MIVPNVRPRKFRLFYYEPNGTYIQVNDKYAIIFEDGKWKIYFPAINQMIENPDGHFVLSEETPLMAQYDKRIYTGDICEHSFRNEFGSWQKVRTICKFEVTCAQFMLMNVVPVQDLVLGFDGTTTVPIIIGNIYLNPELMGNKKEQALLQAPSE